MLDVDYYRNEARKYREQAERAADESIRKELLELAAVLERVANRIEARIPAG